MIRVLVALVGALVVWFSTLGPPMYAAILGKTLAYYSLDEASGANATDASGGGRTLTQNNTVGTGAGASAGTGTSRDFTQSSLTYLQRTDSTFSRTGDFAVSACVNAESIVNNNTGSGAAIASYMSGDQAGDWWVSVGHDGWVQFGHFVTNGDNATGRRTTGPAKVGTSAWRHVVAMKAGSTFTVHVQNVSESLTETATNTGWSNIGFNIGRHYTDQSYHFDGLIDEQLVTSDDLTADEITFLYNGGNCRSWADIQNEGGAASPQRLLLLGVG